jgi:hypothetical protein
MEIIRNLAICGVLWLAAGLGTAVAWGLFAKAGQGDGDESEWSVDDILKREG